MPSPLRADQSLRPGRPPPPAGPLIATRWRLWLAAMALACTLPALAQLQTQKAANPVLGALADLSLEQLSDTSVTSVSGRPQSLRKAAASVYVITGEEIRRSAATSLPEALRLAPNLQVARLNSGQYAISARGFNNPIANKLLVLIDGRTVYSTLFAGVFWDAQDLVLQDIERIEVVSGPGGTLWGANAVNGVINVVTRSAAATQGVALSVTRSHSGGQQSARLGVPLAETGHLRLYALANDRDNTTRADGVERADAARKRQIGFRADLDLAAGQLTLQGDAFDGRGTQAASSLTPDLYGGNLLASWQGRFDNGGPYRLQAYYDVSARDEVSGFRNHARSLDLQFTHEPKVAPGSHLLWGAGYRAGRDANDPSALVLVVPGERTLSWAHVFAQYQLELGERWEATIGAKAERNSYTGVEWLPSLRLAYEHSPRATTWAGLSRAVRAPARLDRDFFFPGRPPFFILGGPDFESEVARVLELGHRGRAGTALTYSATLFRQDYQGLRGGRGVPTSIQNRIDGTVDGLEAWAQWQASRSWRLGVGYLGLRKALQFTAPPADPTSLANLGNDPRHNWNLRSQLDLGRGVEFDLHLRRSGALPTPVVPAYTAVDARLGWQIRPSLELSLVAQNLFDRRHAEFNASNAASQFGRQLFVRLLWQP